MPTFIVDCPTCKAKVGAEEKGRADRTGFDDNAGEPYGQRVYVGCCPSCASLLVGYAYQTHFDGWEGEDENQWSDVIRVYPKPPRNFASVRIPRSLNESLTEADKSMQAGAHIAACVMFGRSLEALCRDHLEESKPADDKPKRRIMLGQGIRELRDKKIIDDRLFDWSQDLNAFRNLAAHPDDISITRQDAEDLQAFVYAITEYVYDLTDRYNEFKERTAKRKPGKPKFEPF